MDPRHPFTQAIGPTSIALDGIVFERETRLDRIAGFLAGVRIPIALAASLVLGFAVWSAWASLAAYDAAIACATV
jgi:hypothetical protein